MRWNVNTYKATWEDAIGILRGWIEPHILSCISLRDGAKVLECGAGSGKWSAAFAMLGCDVYALDFLPKMLKRAKRNFPNLDITPIQKDVRKTPIFLDNSISLLFSEGLVEHFLEEEERKCVLSNFYDVVRKGSYMSLVVPFKSWEDDEISYDDERLTKEICDAGFHILDVYHVSFMSQNGITKREMLGANARK